jgi:hypothetical protein
VDDLLIGALELGDHLMSYGDGVLEKAASANIGPTVGTNCTNYRGCGDVAPEIVADKTFLGVTQNFCYPTKLGSKI